MNYLIFCSYEVGGFPFKMAEMLNRHGVKAYYISTSPNSNDHNSTVFHYGERKEDWDISPLFDKKRHSAGKDIELLKHIKSRYNISGCFATGHKSYFLDKAGIEYKYWSYGSDLDQSSKYFVFPEKFPVWKKLVLNPYFLLTFCRMQKESIIRAKAIMISSYQFKDCRALCPETQLFFLPHLIHIEHYEALSKKKIESKEKICRSIGAERFFFSSTRHFWSGKNKAFTDCKGNDVILYSFMSYLKISGDRTSKLVLVKKGPDVIETQRLAQKLGLSNYIVWIEEMPRDDLLIYYQGASMCFGQFGTPGLTYAAVEPLSNGTPTVTFISNENIKIPFYGVVPPIFNSIEFKEIGNFMNRITRDESYASKTSYDSWLWAQENCSEEQFVKSFVKEMAS